MQDLTLVIPAKHESESLPIFLKEIDQFLCKKIIVLDKNDFRTIDAIKNFKEIKILYQKKRGYGSALIEGINSVNTPFFCIINADGSMNPSYLSKMLQSVKNYNLDFLFASRYEKPDGGSDDDNLITSIGNFLFTSIGNLFFSLKISDILFTYVLGKKESFKNLKITSQDFTFCVEFPIKAKRNKTKYQTMPSYERTRIGGLKKVNALKDGLLILFKMVKMFFIK
jgi:glycosyltransferase involved in cell wall biosynthesis